MSEPQDKTAFDAIEAAGRLLDDTLRRVCAGDPEAATAIRGALAAGALGHVHVTLAKSTRLMQVRTELTMPDGQTIPLGVQEFEPGALQ